jgi:hypothetical protein
LPPKKFFECLVFLKSFVLKFKINLLTISFQCLKNLNNFHKFYVASAAISSDFL